jgi:hypothetical protein
MTNGTRLLGRSLLKARQSGRYLLPLLFGGAIVASGIGASASMAATASIQQAGNIPGIELCKPSAPTPVGPLEGLGGQLGEKPVEQNSKGKAPDHVYTSGGYGGLLSNNYDLGCAANPSTYADVTKGTADQTASNLFVQTGIAVTALTDSVDRRAWDPHWITEFLGDFAGRAASILELRVWFPLLGLGLLGATIMLLIRKGLGDVSGAAAGVAWMLIVLVVGLVIINSPTMVSATSQEAGSAGVSALNGGTKPSDATTDRVVSAVLYQGWLRRTFGSDESSVAKEYGPRLFDASRITYADLDRINAKKKDEQGAEYRKVVKEKASKYKDLAKKIKDANPSAYAWLQGKKERNGVAFVEMGFAIVASFFRLMADILVLMATILLAILGLAWVATAPFLVTPHGRGMGTMLLDNSARALGYVAIGAGGSWMFTIYAEAALSQGMSEWWAMLLLFIGTIIFWTLIRPDRKMLSLLSGGQVNGGSKLLRTLSRLAMAYVGGRVAGAAAAHEINDDKQEAEDEPVKRSEDQTHAEPRRPEVVYGTIDPDPVRKYPVPAARRTLGAEPEYVEAEVIDETHDNQSALPRGAFSMPAGRVPYARPAYAEGDEPTASEDFVAPPAGSTGAIVPYERPAITESREEVSK